MAYGTTNGISNNLLDYTALINAGDITALMVTELRAKADGEIDAKLATVIDASDLPLVAPTQKVNNISDDLTTYYILRRLFMGKDPDDSVWVDRFKDEAMDNLDFLMENPDSLVDGSGDALVTSGVESSIDADPVFGMRREKNGETITGEFEESMEDW